MLVLFIILLLFLILFLPIKFRILNRYSDTDVELTIFYFYKNHYDYNEFISKLYKNKDNNIKQYIKYE